MKKHNIKLNRWILIALLVGFVVYCGWHSVADRPWVNLAECRENPAKFHMTDLSMFQEPKILKLYGDGFSLGMKNQEPIRVFADTANLRENEYVALVATFHQDGYLIAQYAQIAKNRRFKIWGSVIPVLFIFAIAFRFFKFNWRQFEIEVRDHA